MHHHLCFSDISDDLNCTNLLHGLDGGILLLDNQCRIVFSNRWFSQHTGLSETQITGCTLSDLFPTPLPPALLDAIDSGCQLRMGRILSHQLHKQLLPLWRQGPDGERTPLYQSILIKPLSQSQLTLLQCHDITNAVKREQHLRANEHILRLERTVLELIAQGASLDEVLLQLGTTIERLIPGTCTTILMPDEQHQSLVIKHSYATPPGLQQHRPILNQPRANSTCVRAYLDKTLTICTDMDQDPYWQDQPPSPDIAACWAQPIIAAYDEALGVIACYLKQPQAPDESQRQLLQRMAHLTTIAMEQQKRTARIRFLALHDPLTGLPNRSLLNDHLNRNLRSARREGSRFALMFIDLDGFKQINDQYGHDAGDDLLSILSGRMIDQLRSSDICARIGGDEFVVLLEKITSSAAAGQVADKLLACLSHPVRRGQQTLQVSASIGIALYPQDGDTADALLTRADDAMYRAKTLGKDRWHRLD